MSDPHGKNDHGLMPITRKSKVSGVVRTKMLPITEEQWQTFMRGALIQDAFPHLSADDREFIITGITQEEWDATFGGDDDE